MSRLSTLYKRLDAARLNAGLGDESAYADMDKLSCLIAHLEAREHQHRSRRHRQVSRLLRDRGLRILFGLPVGTGRLAC